LSLQIYHLSLAISEIKSNDQLPMTNCLFTFVPLVYLMVKKILSDLGALAPLREAFFIAGRMQSLWSRLYVDSVLYEFLAQRRAMDAELAGGGGALAAMPLDGHVEQGRLDHLQQPLVQAAG
jgi:hypothetical protein